MAVRCLFCQDSQYRQPSVLLADNMGKFANLMEATEFDGNLTKDSLICKDCDSLICSFFDFKASFIEKEDELLNYVNSENKVDLCQVLFATGKLDKASNHDRIKICRTCFKPIEQDAYKEITSYESELAKIANTCLSKFDIFLTCRTFICPECDGSLVKYYRFLLSCIEALKNLSEFEAQSLDCEPLSKKMKLEKKNKELENDIVEPSTSKPLQLDPAVPQKRGRGRPRKVYAPTDNNQTTTKVARNRIRNTKEKGNYTNRQGVIKTKQKKSILSYECQICPGSFDTFETVTKHIQCHGNQTDFICWKCGDSCPALSDLRDHFLSHGLGIFEVVQEEVSSDEDCAFRCIPRSAIKPSQKPAISYNKGPPTIASDESIECQLCLETFRSVHEIQCHIEEHARASEFHCLKCAYASDVITKLQRHMDAKHEIRSMYKIIPSKANDEADVKEASATTENDATIKTTRCPSCSQNYYPKLGHICSVHRRYCCGHCSGVFYGWNALDEHICAALPSTTIPTHQDNKAKTTPEEDESNSNAEADYECSFCLLSFYTVQALDNHDCMGETKSNPMGEGVIKCSHCSAKFESHLDLAMHMCPEALEPGDGEKSEDGLTRDESRCLYCDAVCDPVAHTCKVAIDVEEDDTENCVSKEDSHSDLAVYSCNSGRESAGGANVDPIESHFECSHCNIAFDSSDALTIHNCSTLIDKLDELLIPEPDVYDDYQDKAEHVSLDSLREAISDDAAKIEDYSEDKPHKKKVLNKIANTLGVEIVEGAHKDQHQKEGPILSCVGCDFNPLTKKDLWIHTNFCEKVKKCHCCSYETNISQKLEMHCYTVHDIIIFVCSHCRFATPIEENFEAHMLEHGVVVSDNVSSEEEAAGVKNDKNNRISARECDDVAYVVSEEEPDNKNRTMPSTDDKTVLEPNVARPLWPIESSSLKTMLNDLHDEDENIEIKNDPFLMGLVKTQDDLLLEHEIKSLESDEGPSSVMADVKGDLESRTPNDPSTAPVSGNTDVIDIDSDSDNEFVECAENGVKKIREVDLAEAAELISRGMPVVREYNLTQMQLQSLSEDTSNIAASVVSTVAGNTSTWQEENSCRDINDTEFDLSHHSWDDQDQDSDSNSRFLTANDNNDEQQATEKAKIKITLPDDTQSFVISDDDDNIKSPPNSDSNNTTSHKPTTEAYHEVATSTGIKPKRNKMRKSNKTVRTVQTVVQNNCIVILDEEVEEAQKNKDNSHELSTSNDTLDSSDVNGCLVGQESDDDCVLVTEKPDYLKPKNSGSRTAEKSPANKKVKRPPNAFNLFSEKVKAEWARKHQGIKGQTLRSIILNSWSNISDKDKWCFIEEARLLRILFKREHPDLYQSRPQKQPKQNQVPQQTEAITDHLVQPEGIIEEIVLD